MSTTETPVATGWHAIDLDGTLAHFDHWQGPEHIGAPIQPMVERVKALLAGGADVRIFTARIYPLVEFEDPTYLDELPSLAALEAGFPGSPECSAAVRAAGAIRAWCVEHIGVVLPITCRKDMAMIYLWDDRAVAVQTNTGITHHDQFSLQRAAHQQLAASLGVTRAMLEAAGARNFHTTDKVIREQLGQIEAAADGALDALDHISGDSFKGGSGASAFRELCLARKALREVARCLAPFRLKKEGGANAQG